MKNIVTILLFFIVLSKLQAQESIEKSVFGAQIGTFGAWVHHEARLSDDFSLRSEIGLDAASFISDSFSENTSYALVPTFTLEPRSYYNFTKRVDKKKNTTANAANYISLKTTFIPDWFMISNNDNFNVPSQLRIVPTWGMRRNIGQSNFNYELGFGLGYEYVFSVAYNQSKGDVAVNLHARIGYRF